MPRVPYLDVPDLPPVHLFQALAQCRPVLDAYVALGRALVLEGELPQRLKELALLQVALDHRCDYLWSHHCELGRTVGISDAELGDLRERTLAALSDKEAAAVRYATRAEAGEATDEDTNALQAAGFTPAEIVELTLVVTFYGMTARVLAALDIGLEDGRTGFDQP